MDHAGVLRVNGTRVSLDSVIFAFNEGSTPEEIAQQYTTLNLADIYAVISYYLQNQAEVSEYLERRKMQRAEVKKEVESQFGPAGHTRAASRSETIRRCRVMLPGGPGKHVFVALTCKTGILDAQDVEVGLPTQ